MIEKKEVSEKEAQADRARRTLLRDLARSRARSSPDPMLRTALELAEKGYGVRDVVAWTGIPQPEAEAMVLGQ